MTPRRALVSLGLLTAAVSCLGGTNSEPLDAQIRIINASTSALNIAVDGTTQLTDVAPSNISALFTTPGTHHLVFSGTNVNGVALDVQAPANGVSTAYIYMSSSGAGSAAVLDTGAAVPAGKSKVRVSLLSKLIGNVDVWRTQPDFPTPTKIQTPFPYLTTSPFVQSDSGAWEVFVTPVGSATRLKSTGTFRIPSGGRRTIVLLDSSGVPVFRILPE
jgi:hypothetical protein